MTHITENYLNCQKAVLRSENTASNIKTQYENCNEKYHVSEAELFSFLAKDAKLAHCAHMIDAMDLEEYGDNFLSDGLVAALEDCIVTAKETINVNTVTIDLAGAVENVDTTTHN